MKTNEGNPDNIEYLLNLFPRLRDKKDTNNRQWKKRNYNKRYKC